jgi:DNA-binding NarL/FixJ family response regulator
LEKVKVFKPDLMLIDLVMPKMSGFEAVQHIRAIPGHEKTPLLAVSASVFDEDQQSSLLAGFDGFIPKPIIADQLISYIGRLLNLEWVYKESKEAAQTGEIVSTDIKTPDLSPAEILALFNLAKQGDINGIIEYADRLISLDNQNYPFAHKLKLMAKQFETEEIIEFLKQHWSPPE